MQRLFIVAVGLACCVTAGAVRAQTANSQNAQSQGAQSQGAQVQQQEAPPGTAPIHGQGVMEDRSRTVGPDGWVQAPIPRTQSATGEREHPQNTSESMHRNVPGTGRNLSPGDNPSTPLPTRGSGPGGTNPAAPAR